jgi:hypothetical protein
MSRRRGDAPKLTEEASREEIGQRRHGESFNGD